MKVSLDRLLSAIVGTMEEQLAVVNSNSQLVYVNPAWRYFWSYEDQENKSADPLGRYYFDCCRWGGSIGQEHASAVTESLWSVLNGEEEFFVCDLPYQCDGERYWFRLRVTPLLGDFAEPLFLIGHKDITQRYLADKASSQDSLTGLPDFRRLHEFLYFEWQRCIRSQHWVSLIAVDIDHHKAFNQYWGHLEGDHALQEIAQVLRRAARRPSDIVIRFSGGKFLVVLGDTELADAVRLADELREAVRNLDLEFDKGKVLTLSAGVASHLPQRGEIETLLIDQAEKALAAAKERGRNRLDIHAQPATPRISHPPEC